MKKVLLVSAILLLATACNADKKNALKQSPPSSQSVVQSHKTYRLNLLSAPGNIQPGQQESIKFNIKDEQGNILKDFLSEAGESIRLMVIRKDLQNFQKIHPLFNQSSGEYTADVKFPAPGPYRILADFAPAGDQKDPQGKAPRVDIFEDLSVGDISAYQPMAVMVDTNILKTVGGYRINYNFPANLKIQTPIDYFLIIEREDNEPTKLAHDYDSMGSSMIFKADTLDFKYASSQPMSMEEMGMQMSGEEIDFSTQFPEPGLYKIITQFKDTAGKIVTTDYNVKVSQ
jgi:hypothetical protein